MANLIVLVAIASMHSRASLDDFVKATNSAIYEAHEANIKIINDHTNQMINQSQTIFDTLFGQNMDKTTELFMKESK